MKLQTLDNFIRAHREKQPGASSNAYVKAQGFNALYVRMGRRRLGEVTHPLVFDVANVVASNPGNGAFTRLVGLLIEQGLSVYVECVMNVRFADKLRRMGFVEVGAHNEDACERQSPSFYLLAPVAVTA